jgi:succinoglycan biosynthesis protein ExoV
VKLAYFKDPDGNYGDDLNPWLWDRLLPGVIDDDGSSLLIGMGTILEPWFVEQLDPQVPKVVMGSGGGMEVPVIELDETWQIHAVRGPLTASYLGLSPNLAATDPAMCLRDLWPRNVRPRSHVGFMPHHSSLRNWDWRAVCEEAGLDYVDPHGEPMATTQQISGLRLILTEAMHGAIVADALRVPWLPLQINRFNYVGKWHDWGASIRMPIHFKPLPALYDPRHRSSMKALLGRGARMALWELRRQSSRRERARAVEMLRGYAENYTPYLSADADLDRAIDRFRTILETFRHAPRNQP